MKNYFIQYKPFLLFLGKFFLTYTLFTLLYQMYLNNLVSKIDLFTQNVSYSSQSVAAFFNLDYKIFPDAANEQFKVVYENVYLIRIIEGCNAMSVIILFVAFIIAFSGRLKPTIYYIFGGSALIYILNIFRIVLLTVLLKRFPEQEHLLHGVLFPLIIYGIVFMLWIFWINKFSGYGKK